MFGHCFSVADENESPREVGRASVNLAVHKIAETNQSADESDRDDELVEGPGRCFLVTIQEKRNTERMMAIVPPWEASPPFQTLKISAGCFE